MSVLGIISQDATASFKTLSTQKPGSVEWPAYTHARDQLAGNMPDTLEQTLNRKRAHARRYLGEKASSRHDGYSKNVSRIFTPQFVCQLGMQNSAWRSKHNPWLNTSRDADQPSAGADNILSFGSATAAPA